MLYPWQPITELAEYGLRLILDGEHVRFHTVADYSRTARRKDTYAKVEATLEANRGGGSMAMHKLNLKISHGMNRTITRRLPARPVPG